MPGRPRPYLALPAFPKIAVTNPENFGKNLGLACAATKSARPVLCPRPSQACRGDSFLGSHALLRREMAKQRPKSVLIYALAESSDAADKKRERKNSPTGPASGRNYSATLGPRGMTCPPTEGPALPGRFGARPVPVGPTVSAWRVCEAGVSRTRRRPYVSPFKTSDYVLQK